jgi:hypothetical protein
MVKLTYFIRKFFAKMSEVLLNASSIHGIPYFANTKNSRLTRIFWACAFTLSILGCSYYAYQVYLKWWVTPDIGLQTNFKSIRSIPFPAITICPQNRVSEP